MNSYTQVLSIFKTSLSSQSEIKTVLQGDSNIDFSKKNIYGVAHIGLDTGSFKSNVTVFNAEIQALDQLTNTKETQTDKFYGNDNEVDILNAMMAVLRKTFDELVDDKYTKDIVIVGEADLQKVERTENNLLGWSMKFDIEVPNTIVSKC